MTLEQATWLEGEADRLGLASPHPHAVRSIPVLS
jgi:hypothetical protein